MTPDRLEAMLRTEPIADEVRFTARPLPATVAAARAGFSNRGSGWGVQRFAMASMTAVAVLAVSILGATWLANSPDQPPVGGSSSPAPSPTPPVTPVATTDNERCTAADFAVSSDAWDAGAGRRGTRNLFRVVDSVAECTLPPTITARITDADDNVLVEGTSDIEAAAVVVGGDQLELEVSWSNWCGPEPERPLHLELMLAGDDAVIGVEPPAGSEILVPPCMGAGQESVLDVVGFQR